MSAFCERLKELRKSAGITQSELADTLNIHPQTVSKWERGISEPDISQLGALAEALGITLERLCGQPDAEQTFRGAFEAERFGKVLSQERVARGESQEELAAAMQTSTDTVSRWERGVTCPDLERLSALASHFSLPVSRLYCGAKEEPETLAEPAVVLVRGRRRTVARIIAAAAGFCAVFGILLALLVRPQTFTVTLDGQAVSVSENDWFTPALPSRDGYEFVGWEDETGQAVSFPRKISGDSAYNAVFVPVEYTIDYWLNGGYFSDVAESSFTVESGMLELPVPEKKGQAFEGWYLSADYSGDPVGRISCRGEDVSLYARWSDILFTVRYELDGGALYGENPESVTADARYTLAEPVRAGYVFLGWYDQPQGGNRYECVGGANAKNMTLYALWQKTDALFTVYYDCDGEMLGENPVSVGAGEVHALYGAKKTGYTFLGWNTRADGSGEYVDMLYGIDETLYLYAVFAPKSYLLRYVYEGDYEGEATNPNTIVFGDSARLLPVSLYGHKFLGWFDAEEGGNRVEVIDETNILALSVLYARFEPLRFRFTLEAGKGTIEGGTDEYTVGFGETLPLPSCSLEGFRFLGWNENAAGDGKFYARFTGEAEDKTLYAVFEPKEYLVRYEYEGMYEDGKVNPNYIVYGEKVVLYPVYRTGYEFLGWFDAEEGGNRISVIDESNISGLSRLYARFAPLRFEIRLNADGGTFPTPGGERSDDTVTLRFGETFVLPECTLGGYVFLGWKDENGETVVQIDSLNIRDMSLTASWRPSDQSYHIEYVLNGGTLSQPVLETVLVGQVIGLPVPEREGFLFLGWYDDEEGKGTRYLSTPADRETDFVLYAVWQEIVVSGSAEYFEYTKTSKEVTITRYRGPVGENVDIVFPTVVDGLPVTQIGCDEIGQHGANRRLYGIFGMPNESVLRSMTIPEGVTVLKANAFSGLRVLEPLQIPSSVVSIEEYCFDSYMGEVRFSDAGNLTSIGRYGFHGVVFLDTLVLPEGLKTLGVGAFYSVVTSGVILPDTVEIILDDAFYQPNRYIKYMFVPSSVKYVTGLSGIVYSSMSEEQAAMVCLPGTNIQILDVRESTITLRDGQSSERRTAYAFDLPRPEREGYTFLGWKDESGELVPDCYVPNRDAVLTAFYEEQTSADGRALGRAAPLRLGQRYTFILLDGESFFFRPDTSVNGRIMLRVSVEAELYVYRLRNNVQESIRLGVETDYVAGDVYFLRTRAVLSGTTVDIQLIEMP